MREYLSELFKMQPFSTETGSGGNELENQRAQVASSVSTDTGSDPSLIGILFCEKNGRNSFYIILSLNYLLNGPTYDTKADASNTSPMITFINSPMSTID